MSPELTILLRALADWLYSITEPPAAPFDPLDGDDWFDAAEGFDG